MELIAHCRSREGHWTARIFAITYDDLTFKGCDSELPAFVFPIWLPVADPIFPQFDQLAKSSKDPSSFLVLKLSHNWSI